MWARRRWLALSAICVHITRVASSSADAPTPPDRAKLAALLREGATSARAQKWAACAQAYSEALALEDAPRTAGELGLCEEQLLRFADAFRHLDRALDVAPTTPTTDPWKRYQDAMVRLRSRVAVLFITVTPPDAAVVVDGRPIGRGDGRGVAVEPGEHTIAARLPGYEDAIKRLRVVAPSAPHIDLNLTPLAQAAAPLTAPPAVASPALPAPVIEVPRTKSLPPPLAWCIPERSARGVLGPAACAGVLALAASGGVAIGLTLHADAMRDDLQKRGYGPTTCAGATAPPECWEMLSRGQQRDTAQDVLIGTGIAAAALAGAAAVAITLEPRGPQMTAAVSPGGGGVFVQGTW
jgi:PEGA domain